jgi:hypothetical protein
MSRILSSFGLCAALLLTVTSVSAQNASQSSSQPAAETAAPTKSAKPAKHGHAWADNFLIHGTVFNDKGLAFPGVQVRIRRRDEKKIRWQDATNSRGDFAIRVPHDASYEVLTHAKGFLDQAKTADAKAGLTDQTLAFKLEPSGGKK